MVNKKVKKYNNYKSNYKRLYGKEDKPSAIAIACESPNWFLPKFNYKVSRPVGKFKNIFFIIKAEFYWSLPRSF